MYTLRVITSIDAPPATCFDLARSIDAHLASAAETGERAVAGKTSGLLGPGDQVTWEGRHFGLTQRLSSQITQFRPPSFFQDRMTRGAFKSLEHDHFFEPRAGGTLMVDVLSFAAPLGPLGWLAERLLLANHLRRFLVKRGMALKQIAERETRPPQPVMRDSSAPDAPRKSYEESCRFLQQHGCLDPGEIPPLSDHVPQCDDESPRVSFFRTRVPAEPSLANLTLPRTFFARSEVNRASFRNTDLAESNLCWNDFRDVDFTGAVLTKADMRSSQFSAVNFTAADLRGADLRRSSFERCKFDVAMLDGAVLTREQANRISLTPEQHRAIDWRSDPGDEPGGG